MDFDDSPDQREHHTGSLHMGVEAIEQAKNPLVLLWGDAHTIVAYTEGCEPSLVETAVSDMDGRILLGAMNLAALSIW